MRRRLLFDGEGQGDDRRLNLLLKNVLKFCSATSTDVGSSEELSTSHARVLAQLAQADWTERKGRMLRKMHARELADYEGLYGDILAGIERAQEDIATAKGELKEARKVRRNRMEYDALAKVREENTLLQLNPLSCRRYCAWPK